MGNERNERGQFQQGNTAAKGHGRPTRATERAYLLALSEVVSLEDWRHVCQRALEDAKTGDARARDWLARYVLGPEPSTLLELAADELAGVTPEMEVDAQREYAKRRDTGGGMGAALLKMSGGMRGILSELVDGDA